MMQPTQTLKPQGAQVNKKSNQATIQRFELSPFALKSIQRKEINAANLLPTDVVSLQHKMGNRAVQRLLTSHTTPATTQSHASALPIQAKLQVGPANDKHEQEADRIARQVIKGPQQGTPAHAIQRKTVVQRTSQDGFTADNQFQEELGRTKGSGQPLPEKTRAELEPKFGASFSNVRIHHGATSSQLNRSIQAKAFTHGNDIHFGKGAYNPTSSEGKQLLAHELTHTIQQTGGENVQRKGSASSIPVSNANLTIQRKLNFAQDELQGTMTKTARFKGFFGKESTFSKLRRELAAYNEADGPAEELSSLKILQELASQWLANHGKEKDKDAVKESSIKKLLTEIITEIPIVHQKIQDDADEQEEYIRQIESKNLKYMTSGGNNIAKKMKEWHVGTGAMSTQGVEANKLIKTHNLTLGEASAIGIYTADDYKYMNPAVANNRGWMKAMLPRTGFAKIGTSSEIGKGVTETHVDEAMAEGNLHSKIAKSGMKKLPNWIGTTYRGVGLTEGEFASQYPLHGVSTFPAFSSTSKQIDVSKSFARKEATAGKIAVLLQLRLTKGKDIAELSDSRGEAEILLMPGATFSVSKITEDTYKGVKMYVVELKQDK